MLVCLVDHGIQTIWKYGNKCRFSHIHTQMLVNVPPLCFNSIPIKDYIIWPVMECRTAVFWWWCHADWIRRVMCVSHAMIRVTHVLQKLENKPCRVLGACHLVKILMPSDMQFSGIFSPNTLNIPTPYIFFSSQRMRNWTGYSCFWRQYIPSQVPCSELMLRAMEVTRLVRSWATKCSLQQVAIMRLTVSWCGLSGKTDPTIADRGWKVRRHIGLYSNFQRQNNYKPLEYETESCHRYLRVRCLLRNISGMVPSSRRQSTWS